MKKTCFLQIAHVCRLRVKPDLLILCVYGAVGHLSTYPILRGVYRINFVA